MRFPCFYPRRVHLDFALAFNVSPWRSIAVSSQNCIQTATGSCRYAVTRAGTCVSRSPYCSDPQCSSAYRLLGALRIMMVRSPIQTAQTPFRGRKESVRQCCRLASRIDLVRGSVHACRIDFNPQRQRRRMIAFWPPTNSGSYSLAAMTAEHSAPLNGMLHPERRCYAASRANSGIRRQLASSPPPPGGDAESCPRGIWAVPP